VYQFEWEAGKHSVFAVLGVYELESEGVEKQSRSMKWRMQRVTAEAELKLVHVLAFIQS
jgi:hypothetical protein